MKNSDAITTSEFLFEHELYSLPYASTTGLDEHSPLCLGRRSQCPPAMGVCVDPRPPHLAGQPGRKAARINAPMDA